MKSIAQALIAIVVATVGVFAHAQSESPKLFGTELKNATRDQLREVFKTGGLSVTREDNNYWIDLYDASAVLDGAKELNAGYVSATGRFAFAAYTFPSFMDTEQVSKIIRMVSTKYGKPSSISGSYELGEVRARWNLQKGMQIIVSRGWPATTTTLEFLDPQSKAAMEREIGAARDQQERGRAKSQSGAF